jgi:phosphohistidine phosphatase
MKTLLLMRHAKASHDGAADIDRPLLDEGREAAQRVGKFLKDDNLTVDLALSSPAVRARETITAVLNTAGSSLDVRYDERLYEGGSLRLLEVLSELDEALNTVLLVGHNPVLEEVIQLMTNETVHLSAGTLAHIEVEAQNWNEIGEARGGIRKIVRPQELIGR